MAKKKGRLTRIVSYLHRHNYLDESCFEDEELTEDDFMEGEEELMKQERREKVRKVATDVEAMVLIVGGAAALFMIGCSVAYYSVKGTAGLFKAIGGVVKR